MSQFDDVYDEQNRLACLEQNQQILVEQIQHLSNVLTQFFSNQPTPSQPNLNLPQPPPFSGIATQLLEFKMKLFQLLHGNPHTYTTSQTQLCHHVYNVRYMLHHNLYIK